MSPFSQRYCVRLGAVYCLSDVYMNVEMEKMLIKMLVITLYYVPLTLENRNNMLWHLVVQLPVTFDMIGVCTRAFGLSKYYAECHLQSYTQRNRRYQNNTIQYAPRNGNLINIFFRIRFSCFFVILCMYSRTRLI